ncbi:hypothetical protein LTR70_008157 [Exophiala xenobiotica]|uniref:Extracellular serine-rich protein n=1 Tax=Lithohypha guttulata TaxID=1690604 RepID=A0ABR0K2F0_9EURO|nr:hypothetical protein LTR24_007744 [Lithohypha guttulata]KAK5312476.1 hypothetical protein LTR70_008157 [Exophiala xenobiotica]
MHITRTIAAAFALASLASCTEHMERAVQIVTVGDNTGALKFFPENIKADVGSVVQFQFYPKNHTITESSFAEPCVPMAANLTSETRPGQKSGFVPVTDDTEFRPVYNLIVNDTKPIWIFCGQKPHCAKGMSMVINQNDTSGKTLEMYQAAAAQIAPGSPPAAAPPASGAATVATSVAASVFGGATETTVTPAAQTSSPDAAGPSLEGTVTSAAVQSGSASASIGTFTGAAVPARELPAVGLLAAGAVWALL